MDALMSTSKGTAVCPFCGRFVTPLEQVLTQSPLHLGDYLVPAHQRCVDEGPPERLPHVVKFGSER